MTSTSAIEVFYCYAHNDELLLKGLEKHLKTLQRQGIINMWHGSEISEEAVRFRESNEYLNRANIILLLISSDFMNSDYCYSAEMQHILERHARGETRVIPVILRSVYWERSPLGSLQALPPGAKPVTGRNWRNQDEAFLEVAEGIRRVAQELPSHHSEPTVANATGQNEEFVLVSTLESHLDHVNSLAVSPDGELLASGGWDNTIKLWHVPSGNLLQTLTGHTDYINSVAISSNGHILASGSDDGTIKLWDLTKKEQLLATFQGHSEYVSCVVFTPDQSTLVSGSWDKTIKVWDLYHKQAIYVLRGHSRYVLSLAVSADGQSLASGGWDSIVNTWKLDSGELLSSFVDNSGALYSIAFSPDGLTVASGNADGTIKIWDLQSGTLRILEGHSGSVYSVIFSPDGHLLVSGSGDHTIKIWDHQADKALDTLTNHTDEVRSVVFTPDGQKIISASYDGTIKIWGRKNSVPSALNNKGVDRYKPA